MGHQCGELQTVDDLFLEVVAIGGIVGRQLDLAECPRWFVEVDRGQHHQIATRRQPGHAHATFSVRARQHRYAAGVAGLLGVDHITRS